MTHFDCSEESLSEPQEVQSDDFSARLIGFGFGLSCIFLALRMDPGP